MSPTPIRTPLKTTNATGSSSDGPHCSHDTSLDSSGTLSGHATITRLHGDKFFKIQFHFTIMVNEAIEHRRLRLLLARSSRHLHGCAKPSGVGAQRSGGDGRNPQQTALCGFMFIVCSKFMFRWKNVIVSVL